MVSGKNMWFHGDFQGVVTTLEGEKNVISWWFYAVLEGFWRKNCDFMVIFMVFLW